MPETLQRLFCSSINFFPLRSEVQKSILPFLILDGPQNENQFSERFPPPVVRGRHNSDDSMNRSAKSMPDLTSGDNSSYKERIHRPSSADLLSHNDNSFPSTRSEFLTIPIVKGTMGFGFTIADSSYGQKVKKILDRPRCKNLQEGDILIDINNISVRGTTHAQVVQVLKDCSMGQEANIMVQRGVMLQPPKLRNGEDDFSRNHSYRSRTPTADLYSTQAKEILPNRPKTPLIDTRPRTKHPSSLPPDNRDLKPDSRSHSQFDDINDRTSGYDVPQNRQFIQPSDYQYTVSQSSTAQTTNKPASELSERYNQMRLNSSFDSYGRDENIHDVNNMPNRSVPYSEQFYPTQDYPGHPYDYPPPVQQYNHDQFIDQRGYSDFDYSQNNQSRASTRSVPTNYYGHQYTAQPFYNHNNSFDPGYSYQLNSDGPEYPPRQDSGYSTQSVSGPYGEPYPMPNHGLYPPDTVRRKKESTSFEHEQPSPSSLTR